MSESQMSKRDAALRRLLVERADADGQWAGGVAGRRPYGSASGRFRVGVVTGVVLVAVVAGSVAVLDAVHGTSPTRTAPVPARSLEDSTPTPTPTPTPNASMSALIAKRGAQVRTREELHAFVQADPILKGNSVWEEQAWLKVGCMAEAGFLYDPVAETDRGESGAEDDGLTAAQSAAFEVALYGPEMDAPYDWRTAGCDGLAVHETGQDDAN